MTEEAQVPDGLRYTAEHEWVRFELGSTTVRVGITDYAQQALGDIVFVSLPEVGAAVGRGNAIGEVESTKSVSDLFAPVDGTVSARNGALGDTPELINSDPYRGGWLIEIDLAAPAEASTGEDLLDAQAYRGLLA